MSKDFGIEFRIKKYLGERGIKDVSVARRIGVSASTMSSILNGRRALRLDEYIQICKMFDLPLEYFIKS